jgi:hypothetical protein
VVAAALAWLGGINILLAVSNVIRAGFERTYGTRWHVPALNPTDPASAADVVHLAARSVLPVLD